MSEKLNRIVTATFFATESGYDELIRRWSALMNDKEARKGLTAGHHMVYLMLRSKSLKKACAPVTSQEKLDRGDHRWLGSISAIAGVLRFNRWSYLGGKNSIRPAYFEWCADLLAPGFAEQAAVLLEPIFKQEIDAEEFNFEYDECTYLSGLPSKTSAVGVGV